MSIILTEEQKTLVSLLQRFKCLRIEQFNEVSSSIAKKLYKDVYGETDESQDVKDFVEYFDDKYVGVLFRKNMIFEDLSGYVKIHPQISPSEFENTINAFWVYLSFIDQVDVRESAPVAFPSNMFFIKDKIPYEIIYLSNGQEHLANMLFIEKDPSVYEDESLVQTKLIIGIDNSDAIKQICSYPSIRNVGLENILFVILDFSEDPNKPLKRFVTLNE